MLFFKGVFLGLAITAPVGPINLLCIRRSLHHGWKIGLMTGLGAAVADTFFGAIAAFGLTKISDFLIANQKTVELIGGGAFILMGISLLRGQQEDPGAPETRKISPFNAFTSSLFLTLHNPATIFAFLIAFAALKLSENSASYSGAIVVTSGVFIGSSSWWLSLSWISSKLRSRISPKTIHYINRGTGAMLILLSVAILLKSFLGL